jgi:dihydrodipicolinate synthase/N-acetylneuraminate lyase
MHDAVAILSVVPYYNKPSQEGIYRHYMAVAEASPVPVILYNVPGRTGVNMTAETTLRLAHASDKIVAVKEASGDMEQMQRIPQEGEGFGYEHLTITVKKTDDHRVEEVEVVVGPRTTEDKE